MIPDLYPGAPQPDEEFVAAEAARGWRPGLCPKGSIDALTVKQQAKLTRDSRRGYGK